MNLIRKLILLIYLITTFSLLSAYENVENIPLWKRDPCFTSSLFAATAHTLPAGHYNVRNMDLLWTSSAYGFTNRLQGSLGLFIPVLDGIYGISPSLKFNFYKNHNESIALSIGGQYFRLVTNNLVIFDLYATFHPSEWISININPGVHSNIDSNASIGSISAAICFTISEVALITEFVRFIDKEIDEYTEEQPSTIEAVFLGTRIFGDSFGLDIGVIFNNSKLEVEDFLYIPHLAFTYRF